VNDLVEGLIIKLDVDRQRDIVTEHVSGSIDDMVLLGDRVNAMLHCFCIGAVSVARFPRRSQ
jgi:hypothetical protein